MYSQTWEKYVNRIKNTFVFKQYYECIYTITMYYVLIITLKQLVLKHLCRCQSSKFWYIPYAY